MAAAAGVAAIGVAVAAWLGPVLLVALWLVARTPPRDPRRTAADRRSASRALLALLSLPTLLDLGDYLDVTETVVTAQEELGNLVAPLEPRAGIGHLAERATTECCRRPAPASTSSRSPTC